MWNNCLKAISIRLKVGTSRLEHDRCQCTSSYSNTSRVFDKYRSTSPCTVYNISDLFHDTICIKQGFSPSSMDSAGICYRRRSTLLAKSAAGESVKYIYNTHVWFTVPRCSRSVADTRVDPKQRARERERKRERCPLLKLRYTRQGHPSLQLQLQPPTTKILMSSQIRRQSFRHPFFNHHGNPPPHKWPHNTQRD